MVLSRLGESKALQEVQNQEPSSYFACVLLKIAPFCIVLSGERRPRSRATALGCLKKTNFHMDHYGSNSLETKVYKVYSVYSPPWAQQHMARESADPVHGVMVKGVAGIFGL